MKLPSSLQSYNLYRLLEIESFSGSEEIKRGFRKFALKHHPDRFPEDIDSDARFKLGAEAYIFLKDADRRQTYDYFLKRESSRPLNPKKRNRAPGGPTIYSPQPGMDAEFDLFVEECRESFQRFLETGSPTKTQPKFYSPRSMGGQNFDDFTRQCRDEFNEFLQKLPRLKTQDI